MSINITVAIPIETVVAIQSAGSIDDNSKVATGITVQTTRALIDAVKALPYQLVPKAGHMSFSPAAGMYPRATGSAGGNAKGTVRLTIKTLTGKSFNIVLQPTATMDNVASKIQDHQGIPPDQMLLIYRGKILFRGDDEADMVDGDADVPRARNITEIGLKDGETVHLVLTLRGS
ncbi:hypothetical protein LTR85_010434 [Meristemomyces frigidus]|nr:hypothetical protein LTR85_010434 [Meristemomyces frigidus]